MFLLCQYMYSKTWPVLAYRKYALKEKSLARMILALEFGPD